VGRVDLWLVGWGAVLGSLATFFILAAVIALAVIWGWRKVIGR
jgi:hypothetical protein